MTVQRIVSAQRVSSQCDDSGLCEEVDSVAREGSVARLIASSARAVALVDISPSVIGHSLVSPRVHVTSTLLLEKRARDEVWDLADAVRSMVADLTAKPVVLLEHGLSPLFTGPSCVRHAHVHVAPVDRPSQFRAALDRYLSNVRFGNSRAEVEVEAAAQESHIIGTIGDSWFVGTPDRGIRQVTRALISAAWPNPPADVDWIIGAMGPRFLASMRLLGTQPDGADDDLGGDDADLALALRKVCDV